MTTLPTYATTHPARRRHIRQSSNKGKDQALEAIPVYPINPPGAPSLGQQKAAELAQKDVVAASLRSRSPIMAVAREDPEIFMRVVLTDERTGRPIWGKDDDKTGMYPEMHDEWQRLLSAHDRAVIWSHVEAGKTNQVSIGRTLFELGKNPNLRVVIVSKTHEQAKKIVRTIGQYIKKSAALKDVFPHLKETSDQSLPWTSTMITVDRDVHAKDPSVQASMVHGNIQGSRIDLLIIDDILDWVNTRTELQREELWQWIQATLVGRLTEDARVWVMGNAWHPRDVLHKFAALPGYVAKRYPVQDDAGKLSWPKVWPPARIEARRLEAGPYEFPRSMLCMAREDSDARFKREWIDKALLKGKGYSLVTSIDQDALPAGYMVFHGVDLAVQQHAKADWTVFFTILLWPDGTRQVLAIERGRWAGPDIVKKLVDLHRRFGGLIVVENVAAQHYIVQFAEQVLTPYNVKGFTTGKQKAHPEWGVEGLSAELDAGKWLIPNRYDPHHPDAVGIVAPNTDVWITEMLHYQPGEHTGDVLMASWFAREAARAYEATQAKRKRGGGVGLRVIGGGKASA